MQMQLEGKQAINGIQTPMKRVAVLAAIACLFLATNAIAFPSERIVQRGGLLRPVGIRSPIQDVAFHRDGRLRGRPLNIFVKAVVPPPPLPPPSAAAVFNAQIRELASHSTLAGHLKTIMAKLRLNPKKTKLILGSISQAVHWEELLFFYFMGWLFVPLLALPQNYVRGRFFPHARPFQKSYSKLIADQLAQASRIGFVVYIVDILEIVLRAMGFKLPCLANSPHIVAQSLMTWWLINRVANLKRYVLAIQTRNDPGDLIGSASLVDRLLDAFLYGSGAFLLLLNLQTEIGVATKGFAALGGLSTIIISLASQGFVTQVFYGLFLASSNKLRKGDVVKFGDGKITGLVASLGWMDTLVRGPDGVMVAVPNKDLADKPIRNLSRVQISSVKQELRFKYSDADKIPKLMEDIKNEIKVACPEVIVDGSRPFRAYWTGYGTLGLEVHVEAHFRIKLLGVPFWENRQKMLVAINDAVKKNGMEFAAVNEELLNAILKKAK